MRSGRKCPVYRGLILFHARRPLMCNVKPSPPVFSFAKTQFSNETIPRAHSSAKRVQQGARPLRPSADNAPLLTRSLTRGGAKPCSPLSCSKNVFRPLAGPARRPSPLVRRPAVARARCECGGGGGGVSPRVTAPAASAAGSGPQRRGSFTFLCRPPPRLARNGNRPRPRPRLPRVGDGQANVGGVSGGGGDVVGGQQTGGPTFSSHR